MIEISLRAHWKRVNGTILKDQLLKKNAKIWGSGAEFSYLGIWGPKHKNRHNLNLQHDWNVIEGSLKAY